MKKLWLVLAFFSMAMPVQAVERFIAGEHYQIVGDTSAPKTKNGSVVEFFSYGCPHCEHLEPYLHQWLEANKELNFSRVPAQWNAYFKELGLLYLTLEKLGVADQHSAAVFKYIHKQRKPLRNKAQIVGFAERTLGIPKAEFEAAWESPEVKGKLAKAGQMMRQYKVSGVPALLVNERYYVSVKLAGGEEALFDVVDFLLQK